MASCGNSAQVRATDFRPLRKVGAAVFICWIALVRYYMSLLGGEQRPDLLTQVIPTPLTGAFSPSKLISPQTQQHVKTT